MKKRNGFTLVELLAVIVILGIIILIAIPSYNVITNNIKRKQNSNKIKYIETQAGKYATESGLYSDIDQASITVQTLLQSGYLDGDNKVGDKVLDAYGKDITCYQIKIDFDNGKPKPTFIDENVLNEDGVCILDDLKIKKMIGLEAYKVSSLNENNKITVKNNRTLWVKEDVVLKLKILDEQLNARRDQAITNINWNAVNGSKNYAQTDSTWNTVGWLDNIANYSNSNEYKNIYKVSTNTIMADTKFKITLVVNYIDDVGKKINETLTTYIIVRIDKENPTVTATVDSNWTKDKKKIFITGNDKQGSGISHFCVYDSETSNHFCNPGDNAHYVPLTAGSTNKATAERGKGTYYIWAADNVGNYSDHSARVTVDNIDSTKPTCVYENQNTNWKTGSHTITVKCDDGAGGSGCVTKPYSVTFSGSNKTFQNVNLPSAYVITDYAGNKETCRGPVNVYVDNTSPTATITSVTNNVATSQNVTLNMGDDIGVKEYYFGTSNPSNTTVTWTAYTQNNVVKSITNNGTYYLGVKDAAGNIKTTSATFYKTTLNANGGSASPAYVITLAGNSFTLPSGSRNYYTFNGWYTAASGGTKQGATYKPTGNTTLYIQWSPVNYSISYNLNGGSASNKTSYNIETATFTLNNPTRNGYNFTGWSGTGLSGSANKTVTIAKGNVGNRSYTANWALACSTTKVYEAPSGGNGLFVFHGEYETWNEHCYQGDGVWESSGWHGCTMDNYFGIGTCCSTADYTRAVCSTEEDCTLDNYGNKRFAKNGQYYSDFNRTFTVDTTKYKTLTVVFQVLDNRPTSSDPAGPGCNPGFNMGIKVGSQQFELMGRTWYVCDSGQYKYNWRTGAAGYCDPNGYYVEDCRENHGNAFRTGWVTANFTLNNAGSQTLGFYANDGAWFSRMVIEVKSMTLTCR